MTEFLAFQEINEFFRIVAELFVKANME